MPIHALLLMQSCHMASDLIDEKAVYTCTGNPLPQDIESAVHWLLNEDFKTAYNSEYKEHRPWSSVPAPYQHLTCCLCSRRFG
jgi:hypothetical protein